MYIFHLFRSFLPLRNPIGFGASDFVELAIALLLLALAFLWRARVESASRKLSTKSGWCMLILGALPIGLRLLLLRRYPLPTPNVADDFSYLLLADTLSHFRLANPVHPMHRFFETLFVLQEPSYSSVYPIGQGIALALGRAIFGNPWAGVALSIGLFCALCYWMLRGWTTPGWSLLGGVLAVFQFGPLNQWMNSYWGGAVSACAGCLVFGALPRLPARKKRDAVWLGLGLGLQLLTRQYEFIFLFAAVVVFAAWKKQFAWMPVAALALFPGIALTMLHNHSVTGRWATIPNALSQDQYGVPAAFTMQPNPIPHRELTREQKLDYDLQSQVHDTVPPFFERLASRVRYYRFFFLAPLYVALPFFFLTMREFASRWIVLALALFAIGSNFYPYFYSHYIAAVTCLFVLMSLIGLERLSQLSGEAARIVVLVAIGHFCFWYGVNLFGDQNLTRYENWDAINQGDPLERIAIKGRLAEVPGQQLVFVRYYPQHSFDEWVYNAADIDAARVVWARDLGPDENQDLLRYYPNRTAWLLEPDFHPPRLTKYPR